MKSNRLTIEATKGGIDLSALAVVAGQVAISSGTTPARTVAVPVSNFPFPYVELWGRSVGDTGDDVYVHVFKAKLSKYPEGAFEYGKFVVSAMTFDFLCDDTVLDANGNPEAFEIVQQETSTAVPG